MHEHNAHTHTRCMHAMWTRSAGRSSIEFHTYTVLVHCKNKLKFSIAKTNLNCTSILQKKKRFTHLYLGPAGLRWNSTTARAPWLAAPSASDLPPISENTLIRGGVVHATAHVPWLASSSMSKVNPHNLITKHLIHTYIQPRHQASQIKT
jgi:hypothetical protein